MIRGEAALETAGVHGVCPFSRNFLALEKSQ
jgi:hypothetical protein